MTQRGTALPVPSPYTPQTQLRTCRVFVHVQRKATMTGSSRVKGSSTWDSDLQGASDSPLAGSQKSPGSSCAVVLVPHHGLWPQPSCRAASCCQPDTESATGRRAGPRRAVHTSAGPLRASRARSAGAHSLGACRSPPHSLCPSHGSRLPGLRPSNASGPFTPS